MHSCRESLKFLITFVTIITEIAAGLRSGTVCGLPSYSLDFRYPQEKKPQGLRSGEQGGHGMSPFLDIKGPANVPRLTFIETLAV